MYNVFLQDQLQVENMILRKDKESTQKKVEELEHKVMCLRQQISSMERQKAIPRSSSPNRIDDYYHYNNSRRPQYKAREGNGATPPDDRYEHKYESRPPHRREKNWESSQVHHHQFPASGREKKTERSASDGEVHGYGSDRWNVLDDPFPHYPARRAGAVVNSPSKQPNESHHHLQEIPRSGGTYRALPKDKYIREGQSETTEEEDERYTKALQYVSLEIGELSEAEKTSLKQIVVESYSEGNLDHDIKLMCEKMKEFQCEQQVGKKTNVKLRLDPNLVCDKCGKQFREGEIQKYKKHVDANCAQ